MENLTPICPLRVCALLGSYTSQYSSLSQMILNMQSPDSLLLQPASAFKKSVDSRSLEVVAFAKGMQFVD